MSQKNSTAHFYSKARSHRCPAWRMNFTSMTETYMVSGPAFFKILSQTFKMPAAWRVDALRRFQMSVITSLWQYRTPIKQLVLLRPPVAPARLRPSHILIARRWQSSRWIMQQADSKQLASFPSGLHEQQSGSAHIQEGQIRESLPPKRDGSKELTHANDDLSPHVKPGWPIKIKQPGWTTTVHWHEEGWYSTWFSCCLRISFRFIVPLNYLLGLLVVWSMNPLCDFNGNVM